MLEELKKFNAKWHASKIVVESVQAQTAIVAQWRDDSDLPIIPVKPEKDKRTRFGPTAQLYADNRIWHASMPIAEVDPVTKEIKRRSALPIYFEDELVLFPICEHDDQCDALAYAIMSFGNYWDDDQTSGRHWGHDSSGPISEDECEAA